MIDIQGQFQGLLALSPAKFMYKIGDLKGAFFLFKQGSSIEKIIVGEGIATVQTAWEGLKRSIPAVSAGSASNIIHVVESFKNKHPNLHVIVLIDVDKDGEGLKAAFQVSEKYPDTTFRIPSFEGFEKKGKDFNDLMQIAGWDEARWQLERSFSRESLNTSMEAIQDHKGDATHKDASSPAKAEDVTPKTLEIAKKASHPGKCEIAGEALKSLNFLAKIKDRIVEHRKNPGEIRISGIATGFEKLDEIVDGLQGGHLVILAGRTGMGKTYVALNLLKNIAIEQQIPSALYSLGCLIHRCFLD